MLSEEYLDRCLDFVTTNPARNLGVEYGIEVGKPASFIVLDASTDRQVLQLHAPVLLSVHRGQTVLERQPAVTRWVAELPK